MTQATYALEPWRFLRSIDASRGTLGKAPMKLLDVVDEVRALTHDAPYAVVDGLAQILWARKTHTDDLDVALATSDLEAAYARVQKQARGWTLPSAPARVHEADDVFEVYHLLYEGTVVDLISFRHAEFTREILATAHPVPELGNIRFVRPELLLDTQLLRPGPHAALAAIELTLARREAGDFDVAYARHWAERLGRSEALERTFARADDLASG